MIQLHNAKALRTGQTEAERRLWYRLRAHRFMSLKFRRQKPVGPYIVDFICHACGLIVELDGGQHQDNAAYDRERDAWLRGQGYVVLRFWNHEVMLQMEGVLEAIRGAVLDAQHALSPVPSPASGRGVIVSQPTGFSSRGRGVIASQPAGLPSPACGRGGGGEGARKDSSEKEGSP